MNLCTATKSCISRFLRDEEKFDSPSSLFPDERGVRLRKAFSVKLHRDGPSLRTLGTALRGGGGPGERHGRRGIAGRKGGKDCVFVLSGCMSQRSGRRHSSLWTGSGPGYFRRCRPDRPLAEGDCPEPGTQKGLLPRPGEVGNLQEHVPGRTCGECKSCENSPGTRTAGNGHPRVRGEGSILQPCQGAERVSRRAGAAALTRRGCFSPLA